MNDIFPNIPSDSLFSSRKKILLKFLSKISTFLKIIIRVEMGQVLRYSWDG
jgi:hypothetical protein